MQLLSNMYGSVQGMYDLKIMDMQQKLVTLARETRGKFIVISHDSDHKIMVVILLYSSHVNSTL